jgi:hypothetical protein
MNMDLLKIIKLNFPDIYQEMEQAGIKKYKSNCIKISKIMKKVADKLKKQ